MGILGLSANEADRIPKGMPEPHDPSDLSRRCGEVLHYLWDPIGVAGRPGARDEYDSYVPALVAMLRDGAHAAAIADYLEALSRYTMGIGSSRARAEQAAEALLDWYTACAPEDPGPE